MSLIKSIRRFSIRTGVYTVSPGDSYYTLGAASQISSTDTTVQIYSPEGPAARFCFVHLPEPFNPHKTFIKWTTSGHSGGTQQNFGARIYGTNGYPPSFCESFCQLQLFHFDNWPLIPHGGSIPNTHPEISIELIEFM